MYVNIWLASSCAMVLCIYIEFIHTYTHILITVPEISCRNIGRLILVFNMCMRVQWLQQQYEYNNSAHIKQPMPSFFSLQFRVSFIHSFTFVWMEVKVRPPLCKCYYLMIMIMIMVMINMTFYCSCNANHDKLTPKERKKQKHKYCVVYTCNLEVRVFFFGFIVLRLLLFTFRKSCILLSGPKKFLWPCTRLT